MAYRITTHKGRTTKSGNAYSARHLDRKFNLKNAPHIDPSRTHLNRYVEFYVDESGTLHHKNSSNIQKHELSIYERLFNPRLDIVNANYIKQRHKEKCKTVKDYYISHQSCPDEYLIYIGDKDNHAESDVLKSATSELIIRLQKKYPKNFIPLSTAIHRDEAGTGEDGEGAHIHFRCVWICSDKHGVKASITQGMKAAGIELPNEESGEKKFNNRQMSFSREIRETFAEICEKQFGLDIEREPREASKSGRDLATYQREKAIQEVEKLTAECNSLKEQTRTLKKETNRLKGVLRRFKRLLAPIANLWQKLENIRIGENKSVLDVVLLDSSTAGCLDALRELEEEVL